MNALLVYSSLDASIKIIFLEVSFIAINDNNDLILYIKYYTSYLKKLQRFSYRYIYIFWFFLYL